MTTRVCIRSPGGGKSKADRHRVIISTRHRSNCTTSCKSPPTSDVKLTKPHQVLFDKERAYKVSLGIY